MALDFLINTGSGSGLLPDGTKPLPEPMLTCHQLGPVAFMWGHWYKKIWKYKSVNKIEVYISKTSLRSPWGQWVHVWMVVGSRFLPYLLKSILRNIQHEINNEGQYNAPTTLHTRTHTHMLDYTYIYTFMRSVIGECPFQTLHNMVINNLGCWIF